MEATLARFAIGPESAPALTRLLEALAAEPDPPTTVRVPAEALDAHVADSLSGLGVAQLGAARKIADLGSGAGFPGVVLAAVLGARVDLIEASERKAEVSGRLAAAAGAAGARPVRARAEEWALGEGHEAYDAVTARALAPLAVVYEYAAPLLRPEGVVVAWKGRRDTQEEERGARAAVELGLEPTAVLEVAPFPAAHSRHLHVAVKTAATPGRFPRRAGVAAKRPLGA